MTNSSFDDSPNAAAAAADPRTARRDMVNMNMPPLVDGISGGEDGYCSYVLADELDRRQGTLIPDLQRYFFK
ncbi:hypothetical protein GCM10007919_06790 [Rhizobium indigoferae]|jgi:hypothetical protein|nr:hypothetical protein GCM10007919_06790 [Rhizobium indigoferae]